MPRELTRIFLIRRCPGAAPRAPRAGQEPSRCYCCGLPSRDLRPQTPRRFGVCCPCGLANAQLGVRHSCRRCFSKPSGGKAPRERGPAFPQDFRFRCQGLIDRPVAGARGARVSRPCHRTAWFVHIPSKSLVCAPCASAQAKDEIRPMCAESP